MRLGHQAVFSVCGDAVSVQPVRHGLRVVRSCEAFDLVVTVRELPGFITGVSKAPKKTIKNRIPERAYLQPRAEVSGVVSVVVVVLSDVLG